MKDEYEVYEEVDLDGQGLTGDGMLYHWPSSKTKRSVGSVRRQGPGRAPYKSS